MKEPPPNYFLAIQIKNAQIRKKASELQKHIIEKDPSLTKGHNQSSFHLTLKVVHLKDNGKVELIKSAFAKAIESFQQQITNNQLHLDFQGIGNFYEQILYAKLNNEIIVKAHLCSVLEEIAKEINKSGIRIANQTILEAPFESIQLYQRRNEHQNDTHCYLYGCHHFSSERG